MKLELLLPAGNLKSFIKAVENGADSIYLGLQKFNARRPASNFSIYQLKKVLLFAKEKKIKVYLTLNIDLKSNELKEAVQILELSSRLGIDAIILKDPALVHIINKFYSDKINIHLSTQNAITSSLAVNFAKSQNVKRVILAREIELVELKQITTNNDIEYEIFTEGSMCFSLSGRCLLSSWGGGRSGNRGICTAPCRVEWKNQNNKKSYFSMKDLSLLKYIDEFRNIKKLSLKVEGRLKSYKWVGDICNLYKKVILNEQKLNIDELYNNLKKYSARENKEGHLFNHDDLIGENKEWQNFISEKSGNDDIKLTDNNLILLKLDKNTLIAQINVFNQQEVLQIQIDTKKKKARLQYLSRIKDILLNESIIEKEKIKIDIEESDILITNTTVKNATKEILARVNIINSAEEKLPEIKNEIELFIKPVKNEKKRNKLLGSIPDKIIISDNQISLLLNNKINIKNIVIYLNSKIDLEKIKSVRKNYNLILAIPPVLFEKEAMAMHSYILLLLKEGFVNFEANSYTGLDILSSINCEKFLGIGMPVMNHIGADFYYSLGYKSLYVSLEGDRSIFKSLSAFSNKNIECMAFGKIELFISRVSSIYYKEKELFTDKFGFGLECHKINDMNFFVSTFPLSFIGNEYKKEKIYFDNLTADLRYYQNPEKILTEILKNKFSINSSSFNFFRKLG